MRELRYCPRLVLAVGFLLASVTARADLYVAAKAFEDKDFAHAFELYRELAELGQPEAQEHLAVMYVSGEGVPRDNILGYAWAKIALEQGPRAAAQGIVDQLETHVTDKARARAAALQAQFGKDALQESLLPVESTPTDVLPTPKCRMKTPVNPNDYYPRDTIRKEISGHVLVSTMIWSDGRAHDPRVEYSLPAQVFESAGRAVGLDSAYFPHKDNGVATPCTIRFRVKFGIQGSDALGALKDNVDAIRKHAETGDPRAQLLYARTLEVLPHGAGSDKSIRWFLKAAQAGVPGAQFKVAQALRGGYAVQKDEAKGLIWLNKSADAGNADAQVVLANYLLRDAKGDAAHTRAAALLDRASAESPEGRFYLAALLASHPDTALRNPERVLDKAKQWLAPFENNPIAYEIWAAAQAHLGNFVEAEKMQAKAVKMAGNLDWNTAPQKERLAAYQAGKPWTGDLFAYY